MKRWMEATIVGALCGGLGLAGCTQEAAPPPITTTPPATGTPINNGAGMTTGTQGAVDPAGTAGVGSTAMTDGTMTDGTMTTGAATGATMTADGTMGGTAGTTAPAAGAATFAMVKAQIFEKSCSNFHSCHDNMGPPQSGLDLQTDPYTAIVNVAAVGAAGRTLVVPGDSASSYLFEKISTPMPQAGDRMPPGGFALEDAKIELMRAWIDGGAMNN